MTPVGHDLQPMGVVAPMSSKSMNLSHTGLALFFLHLIRVQSMPNSISTILRMPSLIKWAISTILAWIEQLCRTFKICYITTTMVLLCTKQQWRWLEKCLLSISVKLVFAMILALIVTATTSLLFLARLQWLFQEQGRNCQGVEILQAGETPSMHIWLASILPLLCSYYNWTPAAGARWWLDQYAGVSGLSFSSML